MLDQNQLFRAAVIVVIFGVFILALTFIIPLLGMLVALVIIGAAAYLGYLLLTGRIKF